MKKIFILLAISLFSLSSFSQITISEARNSEIGTIVTVTGIVTNGDELGIIRYIQDATAGIGVYPGSGSVEFTPNRGDEVTVTGTIKEYASLLEIDELTSVTINSTGNDIPEPVVLTPPQIEELYEGQLVKIEEALFDDPGGTFAGNSNYGLTVNGEPFLIRINPSSNIVGEVIPAAVNIVAIISQYSWGSSTEGYQLLPRDMDDMEILTILGITSLPVQSNITTNSFTLSWTTNDTALTRLDYGLTEELELGTIEENEYVTAHSVNLTALEAGTIYYVKAYSILEDDTASTAIKVYSTVSNSSGEMKVYFTQSVDISVSAGEDAVSAINTIEDTIISYIDVAQQTLDIIIYDVESESIVEAINNAYDRGVDIRYITDSVPNTETNPILENLNLAIPILKGNTAAIMHDKFIVIDFADVDNCWVMTGSTNHTEANLGWDYNNMICIQDQALAKAFLLEFNEMWGANGMTPNPENAKFGSAKKDNTPHNFIIGGSSVELYFSPSDHATSVIVNALETAEDDLEFAIMVFTENSLGNAVKDAYDAGANVRGIIDYVEYSGSEFNYLLDNGVNVLDYQNPDGTSWPNGPVFHHKYAIVDFNSPDSDPILITGSHNWSASAESSNDENTLIIHDALIANLFHQEFTQRYFDILTPVTVNDTISMIENDTLIIDILLNDFVHNQVTSTTITSYNSSHGTAEISDNKLVYIPETDFYGEDSVLYKVSNTDYPELYDTAYCFITIIEEQEYTLTAIDDTISIPKNTTDSLSMISYNILANDENPYGLEISFNVIKQASHGAIEIFPDDSLIIYTPDIDYVGADTIVYMIFATVDSTINDIANFIVTMKDYVGITINRSYTNNFNIFPNPNNGNFTISMKSEKDQNVIIKIYDHLGKLIKELNKNLNYGNNNFQITNKLDNGIYLLQLKTENEIFNKKILISN
ncbi:MAG: T9SS type A sorting domain-containing protein [Bacteroidales bacterium]|nr:T9SS type A sorting domain-containing protein [Bacteroidales bacterium]